MPRIELTQGNNFQRLRDPIRYEIVLLGGDGDDELWGDGSGQHTMFGGAGVDHFISLASTTIIRDFDLDAGETVEIQSADFINATAVNLTGLGTALFISGTQADTFILADPIEIQNIFDNGVVFV
jgi:hypothetical protein